MAAVLVLLASAWWFIASGDPAILILGALLAAALLPAGWVVGDAARLGLPPGPWALVAVLMPGLGLALYLVAREVRRGHASRAS